MNRISILKSPVILIFILMFLIVQGSKAQNVNVDNIQISNINNTLLNQYGEYIQFSELIKGKVVVMNFIYTTCTTICPPMGAIFGRLKTMLTDKLDKEFVMLSVSIDPITDTPERLKAWSEKFGNHGKDWTLLTGGKSEIDNLLKELNVFSPDKHDHAPIILIGREGKGNWIQTSGLSTPSKIIELIDSLYD